MSGDLRIQQYPAPQMSLTNATRFIGNNIVRWTNPQNGAQILSDWQGEDTIAMLNYPASSKKGDGAATADLEFLIDVGPTASALCSASRLTCETAPTANQYLPSIGLPRQLPATTLGNFLSDGNHIADSTQKPSMLHILFGLWFEYDSLNPELVGAGPDEYNGVGHPGIGTNDVMLISVPEGGSMFVFTDLNEFTINGAPPQSSSWCQVPSHAMWIVLTVEASPNITVQIRPPGYAAGGSGEDTLFFAPPNGFRYYVHAQGIYGCGGIVPGSINAVAPSITEPTPRSSTISNLHQREHP